MNKLSKDYHNKNDRINKITAFERNYPLVSIVIPTKNRKKKLKACLNSLFKMDYPSSSLEIIVVDGGSSDKTIEMIKNHFSNVTILVDKRQGISYARNTGGKHARGKIIAFTDDDCIADRNWISVLLDSFHGAKIAAVGGPVSLLNKEIFPKKLADLSTLGLFSLDNKKQTTKLLLTANFAVNRNVFEIIKFDENFGRRNTLLYKWEEDLEYCQRLIDLGYKLLYIPNAKIYHNSDFARIGIKYIILRQFFGGLSHYMVERKLKTRFQIGLTTFRLLFGAFILFYKRRNIVSFCWLIKLVGIICAVFFVPF